MKLSEPVDGWKDNAGKPHKKHTDAFRYNLVLNTVLWQLYKNFAAASGLVDEATHDPDADVKLARLVPRAVIERDIAKFTVPQLLEIGLNYIHEASHALYLTHAYNLTVAEAFLGDPIHGAERIVPVEDRVDSAIKRVQKNTPAQRAAIGQLAGRGGSTTGRRGGSGRRGGGRMQQPYFGSNFGGSGEQQQPIIPPGFGRGAGGGNQPAGGGANVGKCWVCGASGHYDCQRQSE